MMKVYELADEYKIEARALLNHLRELGIFVSSHMSLLDEGEVEKVRLTISHVQRRREVMEKRVKPTVIRRRLVKPAPDEPPEPPTEVEPVEAEVHPAEAASHLEALEAVPDAEPAAQEAAELFPPSPPEPESATPPEQEPEPSRRVKRKKAAEAAIIIRKPEPAPESPPAPEEAPIEVVQEASPPAPTETAEAAEVDQASEVQEARVEEVEGLPEEPTKKGKRTRAARAKRAKGERAGMEPAKIVERPRRDVLERIVTMAPAAPSAPPSPESVSDLAAPRKTKPKKRKALKAFEVIHEERPARGRRKKEVIQLRDEVVGRARPFRVTSRKKEEREPRKTQVTVPKAIKRKIRMADVITVGELAKRMGIKVADVIKVLMGLGKMTTVNQLLDLDEAGVAAGEFGYEVERVVSRAEEILEGVVAPEMEGLLEPRPPVVTVMGHVDHGKTSLLDAIRQTQVTDQEVGGITQHIGAYQASVDGHTITFLDTPGHEAFTSLRARGAQVTDIVVLVVAADDGVMNQTREAYDHAKAAGVPIIAAINKIDKPNAEPQRVKQELANLGLVPEEWGGETMFCEVSARNRTGIDALLESILLQAEVLELKANLSKLARGTVIEAKLDRHRGAVATILIQEGTLRKNDAFVAGAFGGKIRMMLDFRGRPLEEAGPSTPVEVVGFSGVPQAGEKFLAVGDEKEARDIEAFRQAQLRKGEVSRPGRISLDRFMEQMDTAEIKELAAIVKGDVQGSIETLRDTLARMGGQRAKINVIHASVGGITENDVNLASASDAIIIGFNVRPEPRAQSLAEELGVDLRLYNIIYELIEDVRKALIGMLEPVQRENLLGRGEVIQIFKVSRVGTVAGTMLQEGKVVQKARVRLVRDGVVVHQGKIDSLRRYKDDAREVVEGQDCGIRMENFNDVKVGDLMEFFELDEIAPEL